MTMRSHAAALGAAGIALLAATASTAADLGPRYRAPPPAYDARAPLAIERWTGFYFGGTLGYASGTVDVRGGSGDFGFDQTGGVGTLFAGYNIQTSANMVLGLEADIGTGYLDGTLAGHTAEQNVFGSLRARAGVLLTPQTLLYATGGLAWANYDFKVVGANLGSETLLGYQLGAGLEFALAPQWTLRAEYLYTDYGKEPIDHGGGLSNTYNPSHHTLRAGFAVKF